MPSMASVAKVRPGLAKDKLYALLGPPHFDEGFVGVREWDYIFTFKNIELNMEETCQFKIIYGPQMRVQETFWKPAECSWYAAENSVALPTNKPLEKVGQHEQALPSEQKVGPANASQEAFSTKREKETILVSRLRINADGLFAFDESEMRNLLPGGKARLDHALTEIKDKGDLVSIKVLGYTDRLGSEQYNLALSEARAKAIKHYLVSQGIQTDKIIANGLGETAPLVTCESQVRNAALIACLQANRRFEIEVETIKKESFKE
jgi:OOP family OmpA-OmpF porin